MLSYSVEGATWQTWPASAKGGSALLAYAADDAEGKRGALGYALFRASANADGKPAAITLLQCASDPGLPEADARRIVDGLLRRVFSDLPEAPRRNAFAVPASQPLVREALAAFGFAEKYSLTHMRLRL